MQRDGAHARAVTDVGRDHLRVADLPRVRQPPALERISYCFPRLLSVRANAPLPVVCQPLLLPVYTPEDAKGRPAFYSLLAARRRLLFIARLATDMWFRGILAATHSAYRSSASGARGGACHMRDRHRRVSPVLQIRYVVHLYAVPPSLDGSLYALA